MEIEVVIMDDADEEELYMDTKILLQHLDLSKVKDMKNGQDTQHGQGNGGSRKLRSNARKGYELRGVDFTVCEKMREDPGKLVS